MAINFSLPKNQTKKQFLLSHRELLIGFCVLSAAFVFWFFPQKNIAEAFFATLLLLFVFPALVIMFLLREHLRNFGIAKGNMKRGIALSCIAIALFLVIDYAVVKTPALKNQISLYPGIASSYWTFLWLELAVFLSLHFIWEFFFRGFLQFGLEKNLGVFAILAQAALQSLVLANGSWVMASLAFLAALAAGVIARESRSIAYSFATMWIISISLDIMMLRALQQSVL